MKTILSYGMGVESSALLLRWLERPESRDFDLERDLIVITAQTGGEHLDTKRLCEQHLLPRMRAHRVRYVQVARAGHLEADGIIVLSDTREPFTVHIQGVYTLAEELRSAGTVPQFSGDRICSLKKYWVRRKKRCCFFLARGVATLAPTDRLMQSIFVSPWLRARF
jgi:hypothetical protein